MRSCTAGWSGPWRRFTTLLLVGALKQVRCAGRGAAPHTAQMEADRNAEDLMAENGFVPVPYAAPLAPGEFVEVVQRELTPAALARMGFVIQPAYSSDVTADLMVGAGRITAGGPCARIRRNSILKKDIGNVKGKETV